MNIDSTSAIAVTAGSMLLDYPAELRSQALIVLTLLVAGCMLLAGLLKLGFLTRFVSTAVMTGFITGIAVNIILGQLGDLTGYSSEYSNKVVKGLDTLLHLGQVDWPTLAVGLATIALILVLDRTPLRKVSLLVALVAGSALVPLLGLGSVALVADVSPMPETLPRPALPDLGLCSRPDRPRPCPGDHRPGAGGGDQPEPTPTRTATTPTPRATSPARGRRTWPGRSSRACPPAARSAAPRCW